VPDSKSIELAQARQHVESGRRIVAAQESLVAEIAARGGNVAFAQSLLDSFRRTQAIFEDDLRRLSSDGPVPPA
jgi:hypothetical protein